MIKVLEKAKIKTEELFFQLNDKISANLLVESLNYTPYIYIKKIDDQKIVGVNVDPRDIVFIKLFNDKTLPEIELSCYDTKGLLFNDMYPFEHDTLICVFFKSNSENTLPIRMDFRCTTYETVGNNDLLKYNIYGKLNVDDLEYSNFEAKHGTSFTVLKELALQMNLGWASNVSDSDDDMCWINPGYPYLEFIRDIAKHSWVSEESFVWIFIDFWYNLNYVDVNLEINEFNNEEIGEFTDPQLEKNAKEKTLPLYLTNNKAFNMTNKYISKFNLVNQSFKVNLINSYKLTNMWYTRNDNTIHSEEVTNYQSDETKLSSKNGKLNLLRDDSSEIFKQRQDVKYDSKFDIENVHTKYSLAKYTNELNLNMLEKMKMIITLNHLNFSIKRFQNLKIEIYNNNDLLSLNANTTPPENNINTRLSGFWFVTGINYIYRRSGSGGKMEQEITVMRRDLSVDYGQ